MDWRKEERMEQEKVYVALGKEYKEGKPSLVWALQNISKETKIVLLHVHCPSNTIPILGARFPASQLHESQISAYRQLEREKMHTTLHEYMTLCSQAKVQAEKLVIDMDDIGKGIVELIELHGIDKLVMGTKQYSRKTRMPKSKIAISLHQQAEPSCKIWFICKGNLICTREAVLYGYGVMQSPIASSSRHSVQSEPLKLRSLSHGQNPESVNCPLSPMHEIFKGRSRSVNFNSNIGGSVTPRGALHLEDHVETLTTESTTSTEGSIVDPREGILSSYDSLHSTSSVSELFWDVTLTHMLKDEGEGESVSLPSVHKSEEEEVHFLSTLYEMEAVEMDNEVYEELHDALKEAERLKREAYDDSQRRQKAEMESIEAAKKAKASFSWYLKELKRRKELEETLARKNIELGNLKIERDKVREQESVLLLQIADSNCIVKNLEEKLSASHELLNSLQRSLAELQQERDIAVRVANELRKRKEDPSGSTQMAMNSSDFSYSEIEQATKNFDDSMKIGEGGYGSVYKGFLRHTTVAIKMLNPESMQGQSEFHQEVDVLSRVRHPHLVTLIGTCSEAWALIYEYCSNGSLEDRLVCKDNTPPLQWKVRIRIASEVCASLIFLHSSKPHSVVHGDLKPANILMDGNLLSKLGDFGICRLLMQSTTTTLYHHTQPKGTFVYVDPEFMASGDLTSSCDVYSFGIILLRLLTGRPALGVIKVVQLSLNEDRLHEVLDPTAGDWPFVQAKQLAHLALRCCEIKRKKRPDLEVAWKVLEPMTRAVSSCSSWPNLSGGNDGSTHLSRWLHLRGRGN